MENAKKLNSKPLGGIEKKSLKKIKQLPAKDRDTSREKEELHLKACKELLILSWINPFG